MAHPKPETLNHSEKEGLPRNPFLGLFRLPSACRHGFTARKRCCLQTHFAARFLALSMCCQANDGRYTMPQNPLNPKPSTRSSGGRKSCARSCKDASFAFRRENLRTVVGLSGCLGFWFRVLGLWVRAFCRVCLGHHEDLHLMFRLG